jgi:DNA-binding CsgD family transcriptional regulator/tetratricopeptide (TPR) repeat protein
MQLLGRRAECEALDGVLADALAGRSRVAFLRGEAGAGKSALLGYLSGRVAGWHVATASGVESEVEFPYSGLHQLCAPVLDRLDRLPAPQADALATVFGLSAGPAPDRFLVGLATLTLFAEVAEQQPLVCIIDDAQWLDGTSAQIVGFVARRLLAERIAIVCAVRTDVGDDVFSGLPTLSIDGLGESDARTLLLANVYGPLDAAVCEQIIHESHGNPLALIELGRLSNLVDFAGGFGVPASEGVAGKIERAYAQRLDALPTQTRLLVLVAAAEPLGDRALLVRAAEILGIEMDALSPALDEGLIKVDARVEFAHPLARSAAYHSAGREDRHRIHAALAEVTDHQRDPDRRAWHRARAVPGPDDEIATELERSAARAQARGGVAAAAAFLHRAVELTQDRRLRAERALTAGQMNFQAGAFDAALTALATAEAGELDAFGRAQADLLRGHLRLVLGYGDDAAPLLLRAAKQLESFDMKLARSAYLLAYGSAIAAAHLGQAGLLLEICRAIEELPPPDGTEDRLRLVLEGLARMHTDGRTVAVPILKQAATAVAQMPVEDVLRWGWLAPIASHLTWDSDGASAIFERQAKIVRNAGVLAELPVYLSALAIEKARNGDLTGARLLIAESETVTAVTSSRLPPFAALQLHALLGDEAAASALIEDTMREAGAAGQGEAVRMAQWAAAVLYNGLGRYKEATSAARQAAASDSDPYPEMWALPELVEAAVRVGEIELAREAFHRLVEKTRPAGTDWALGIEARSQALLSDGENADSLYQQAVARLGRTALRPELARAHLLYGEWLRREGRRIDAREQLRAAHDWFAAIGMEAFAERARRELLATGEKARKRTADTRGDLTPQEAQIAQLAREGFSNPEIGAQLFLSPRTVEWHLRKVFTKLDISSRKALDAALRTKPQEPQLR